MIITSLLPLFRCFVNKPKKNMEKSKNVNSLRKGFNDTAIYYVNTYFGIVLYTQMVFSTKIHIYKNLFLKVTIYPFIFRFWYRDKQPKNSGWFDQSLNHGVRRKHILSRGSKWLSSLMFKYLVMEICPSPTFSCLCAAIIIFLEIQGVWL